MEQQPENSGLDNKSAAERDRIEINHEIAGVDVGRMHRFLNNTDNATNSDNSEKKKSERAMTMLRYMLENDKEYAQLYSDVAEKLDKAQQEVNQALININQRLAVSDRELLKMEDNSAKADDGTSVFKSSDGSIYAQDGQRLSDEDAQKISVPDDAPSWESYKAEKEKREALQRSKENIERYERDVLKSAQARLKDQDNPISKDELKEIDRNIAAQKPAELAATLYGNKYEASIASTGSVAAQISPDDTDQGASIKNNFNKASLDLTDDLDAPAPQRSPTPAPAQALAL